MGALTRYLELKAKEKTGLSAGVVASAAALLFNVLVMFVFVCVAAFVWIEQRQGGVIAGLALAGLFFALAVIAGLACVVARGNVVKQARKELAGRSALVDPQLMKSSLQVASTIGLRRLIPVIATGALAAGLALEWRKNPDRSDPFAES
jgi:hypothetical protein